ncbi:MAG: class I SAM-dependent methyltransferase [Opitutales bacterium]
MRYLIFFMVEDLSNPRLQGLEKGNWCLDDFQISFEKGILELSGWCLDLPARGTGSFFLNGVALSSEVTLFEREDIDTLFGYVPKSRPRGFSIQLPLSRVGSVAEWRLNYGRSGEGMRQAYFGPGVDFLRENVLWPNADRRFRVHGSRDLEPFILEGLSCAKKIEALAEAYSEMPLKQLNVLDWGCGCARVGRWLHGKFKELSGVDIDADNAAWCREYFDSGEWKGCELSPPLPFDGDTFDLLYGVSVFTHIAESAQSMWLKELSRVLKPNALALVSVHGPSSAARFGLSDTSWDEWRRCGILDLGPSRDLEAVFGEHEHYRGTLHTEAYLRDNWSEFFEVEAVVPAIFGNHQDVVVLRNRGTI